MRDFMAAYNANRGEQRTICEECGNSNLAHNRAVWTLDGSSYCPPCSRPDLHAKLKKKS